jgi:hypothetical protein
MCICTSTVIIPEIKSPHESEKKVTGELEGKIPPYMTLLRSLK